MEKSKSNHERYRKKLKRVSVRLNEVEYENIKLYTSETGLTVNSFLLHAINKIPIIKKEEAENILNELNLISSELKKYNMELRNQGTNLNQIAHRLNEFNIILSDAEVTNNESEKFSELMGYLYLFSKSGEIEKSMELIKENRKDTYELWRYLRQLILALRAGRG